MIIKNTKQKIFDGCIYIAVFMGIFFPGAFVGAFVGIATETEWLGSVVGGLLLIFQLYFLPKLYEL